MELHSKKKILVGASHHRYFVDECLNYYWRQSGIGTFYLYLVLMEQKIWKTLLAIVLILQLLFIFLNFSPEWFYHYGWLIVLSVFFIATLLFVFPVAKVIFKVWSALTTFIGNIISKLALTVIYFLVLWPVSLLRKLAGRDNGMFRQKPADAKSYFNDSNKTFKPDDFKNPW